MTHAITSTFKERRVTPTGVLMTRWNVDREEWLRLRMGGIGGSDALAVLGMDRYRTRLEVFLDKTGADVGREQSDRMRWGQIAEAPIAEWFSERTGVKVRRCGLMRNADRPWQRVSVDRLTRDDGLLEIKNTNYHRRGEWEDDDGEIVADGAEAQAQHALAVTGYEHAWVCAQVGGEPPVIRKVMRDEAFIRDLTAVEAEFWALVEAGEAPALEGGAAAVELMKRMFPNVVPGKTVDLTAGQVDLLREYKKEGGLKKAADNRQDEIKAQIEQAMGDAEFALFEGKKVASWSGRSRAGVPKDKVTVLRERHPAVAAEVVEDKPYRQFGLHLREAA